METVTHDGRTTAYRVDGDLAAGEPTLFVHGAGETHACWVEQFERAAGGPTVAVDLSGRGESADVDTDPGMATIDEYARDVVAVAEETDAAVAVGHSMGGAVLQWALLEHDFDPDGVALVCTAASFVMGDAVTQWLDSGDFAGAVEFLHERGFLFHDTDHENVTHSMAMMRDAGLEVMERDLLSCGEFDVRDRLGEITTPTLVVTADDDQLTPPSFGEYLRDNIAGADHRAVSEAGHLAMLERPDVVNEALDSFRASVAEATTSGHSGE